MGPPPGAIRICRIMQQSGTKGNFFTYHYHQCHDSKATLRDRCEGAVDSSINGIYNLGSYYEIYIEICIHITAIEFFGP